MYFLFISCLSFLEKKKVEGDQNRSQLSLSLLFGATVSA